MNPLTAGCALLVMGMFAGCGHPQGRPAALEVVREAEGEAPVRWVATSPEGFTMRARINGQLWVAEEMIQGAGTESRRVEGRGAGRTLGFSIWFPRLKTGSTIPFQANNPVEMTSGEGGVWFGREGVLEITKINEKIMEATFHFTASAGGAMPALEVTDGYVRLPLDADP